jgi:hypothetical protein
METWPWPKKKRECVKSVIITAMNKIAAVYCIRKRAVFEKNEFTLLDNTRTLQQVC